MADEKKYPWNKQENNAPKGPRPFEAVYAGPDFYANNAQFMMAYAGPVPSNGAAGCFGSAPQPPAPTPPSELRENMKFCPSCGLQIIKTARFCSECGAIQPE